MFNEDKGKLMMLYGLTSSHVGTGDNLSYIDLPIQREKHTGYPKIEASSLKGSIRQAMEQSPFDENNTFDITKEEWLKKAEKWTEKILGSKNDGGKASAVAISDARILFFPVKSAKGIFAWVTSPMVMQRFEQDCRLIDFENLPNLNFTKTYRCEESTLLIKDNENKIVLEEFDFEPEKCKDFETWIDVVSKHFPDEPFAPLEFKKRVVMIPDEDFKYFVTQSTEVITRIKIDSETGVVDKIKGGLFTEEYLPPESILYSLLFFADERPSDDEKVTEDDGKVKKWDAKEIEKKMGTLLAKKLLQIGGNTTHGKGLFKIRWKGEKNE